MEGWGASANGKQIMLDIYQKNGLILSPSKMKIAVPEIEFLGAILGHQRIKFQPHIISKVAEFKEDELKTKHGMRSWLGLLNYARNYIPNLLMLSLLKLFVALEK